ncbi:hypothetical protein F5Y10DRAFT_127971 [Nemania abortiva]|nr:hypothetical protein F5Y10DRAFT_127971 [Nemania abortiva]
MARPQSRKRARVNDGAQDERARKRIKSKGRRRRLSNYPPEFWDELPKIDLSPRALRELDRRNSLRPATKPKAPEGGYSKDLTQFARHGGPDLQHLRGYKEPRPDTMASDSSSSDSGSREKPLSPSDRGSEFERHLYVNGIYIEGYHHAERCKAPVPGNIDEIRQSLSATRASLLPSPTSTSLFLDFTQKNGSIAVENQVTTQIIPILCGDAAIPSFMNVLFTEYKRITDGKISRPQPDFFDGALLRDIDKAVWSDVDMYTTIIPTKHRTAPVAPNLFLEVKCGRGSPSELKREACYYGAYGARAMHSLQNYGRKEPVYDNNAYTFSATYQSAVDILRLYAHYLKAPTAPGEQPAYYMTKLGTYIMTEDFETFLAGMTAFRNARDLAKQHRDNFIKAANARARQGDTPTRQANVLETTEPQHDSATNSLDDVSQHVNGKPEQYPGGQSLREAPAPQESSTVGDSHIPSQASVVPDHGDPSTALTSSAGTNQTSSKRSERSKPSRRPHTPLSSSAATRSTKARSRRITLRALRRAANRFASSKTPTVTTSL